MTPKTSSSSSSSSSSASLRGCCCCLFLLISFLALLSLALILILLFAIKPKKPTFELQQVTIQYLSITPTSSSSSATLSLNVRLLFLAKNDNNFAIRYDDSKFTIMYKGIPLGRGEMRRLDQEGHSVKEMEIGVVVDRVNLDIDGELLLRDASLNDRVELRVLGDFGARIRTLGLTSPAVQVSVDCTIGISPRKQALIYKQCGFDGLSV